MRKLLLSKLVSSDDVLDFFYEANWDYIREHEPEDDQPDVHEIEWTLGDNTHSVTFFEDRTVELQYFYIVCKTPAHELETEKELRTGPFEFASLPGLICELDAAVDPLAIVSTFAKLAIIAPTNHDPEYTVRVESLLRHPLPSVRAECLGLLTYIGWPELISLVQPLANDTDESVRKNAVIVLDSYKAVP
jgi:hypothetical protein